MMVNFPKAPKRFRGLTVQDWIDGADILGKALRSGPTAQDLIDGIAANQKREGRK